MSIDNRKNKKQHKKQFNMFKNVASLFVSQYFHNFIEKSLKQYKNFEKYEFFPPFLLAGKKIVIEQTRC